MYYTTPLKTVNNLVTFLASRIGLLILFMNLGRL